MGKRGKTPSLLAISTGTPEEHTCGRATQCERCEEWVATNDPCFRIPKMSSGYTHRPIFCITCTIAIVDQTKVELLVIEGHLQKHR
jgi:hypothetical protein